MLWKVFRQISVPIFCSMEPSCNKAVVQRKIFHTVTKQAMCCAYNVTLRHIHCRRKAIILKYSEHMFLSLVIQHEKLQCGIILSFFLSGCTTYFFKLFRKGHDFRKKGLIIKCVSWFFPTTFAWNTSHSKNKSPRYYDRYTYIFM